MSISNGPRGYDVVTLCGACTIYTYMDPPGPRLLQEELQIDGKQVKVAKQARSQRVHAGTFPKGSKYHHGLHWCPWWQSETEKVRAIWSPTGTSKTAKGMDLILPVLTPSFWILRHSFGHC